MRSTWVAVLLVLAPLAGCSAPPATGPPVGLAPDWSFVDTQGQTHSRAASAGHPAVLFFMATWCSSCRALTPELASVHRDHAAQGLQLFSVTIEPTDDDAKLEAWKQRFAQPWPHGRDPSGRIVQAFEVVAQSSVAVLDANGTLVQKWGYPGPSGDALRAAVAQAFDRSTA